MKIKALLATAVVAFSAAGYAHGATLVGSYLFNNNLNSSVAGAPALTATDPLGTSGFATDAVFGNPHTVYHVDGAANPAGNQGGLTFNSTGLLTADSYSIALTIDFAGTTGWRRIVDVQGRQSDAGFYVDPSSDMDLFGASGSAVPYNNTGYNNIVLTVGPAGPNNVTAYLQGGLSFSTTTSIMNLGSDGLINLFLDNVVGGGLYEWSPVNIAAVNFYNGVLTADEAAAINGDPLAAPPTAGVPEPAAWAMMITGFFGVGATLRRRRMTAATLV